MVVLACDAAPGVTREPVASSFGALLHLQAQCCRLSEISICFDSAVSNKTCESLESLHFVRTSNVRASGCTVRVPQVDFPGTVIFTVRPGPVPYLSAGCNSNIYNVDMADAAFAKLQAARAKGEDVKVCLQTLQRAFFNIIGDPQEPKYRTIKKTNETIRNRILYIPGGLALLLTFGFVDDGDVLVLPASVMPNEGLAAKVTELLANIQDEETAAADAARKAELLMSAQKREEARKERERITALAKLEQAERRDMAAATSGCASKAVPRAFGANTKGINDIRPPQARGGG